MLPLVVPRGCGPKVAQAQRTLGVTGALDHSGESGIRTLEGVTLSGFQDQRIRPLCQLSKCTPRLLIKTATFRTSPDALFPSVIEVPASLEGRLARPEQDG